MISTHTEAQKLQLQMQLLYFFPILLLIGNAESLLQEVTNLNSDINQVESYEGKEQQTFDPKRVTNTSQNWQIRDSTHDVDHANRLEEDGKSNNTTAPNGTIAGQEAN